MYSAVEVCQKSIRTACISQLSTDSTTTTGVGKQSSAWFWLHFCSHLEVYQLQCASRQSVTWSMCCVCIQVWGYSHSKVITLFCRNCLLWTWLREAWLIVTVTKLQQCSTYICECMCTLTRYLWEWWDIAHQWYSSHSTHSTRCQDCIQRCTSSCLSHDSNSQIFLPSSFQRDRFPSFSKITLHTL